MRPDPDDDEEAVWLEEGYYTLADLKEEIKELRDPWANYKHLGCPNWPNCKDVGCGRVGDDPPGHRG